MKKSYCFPMIEVYRLEEEDIITLSYQNEGDGDTVSWEEIFV